MQDNFHWRAYLNLGGAEPTCVDEYDDEYPTGRGIDLLPQDAVLALELLPQREDLRHVALQLPALADVRLVFFRKRSLDFDPESGALLSQSTIHCLGWMVPDTTLASYCFIFEDGSTLLSDNMYAV